MQRPTWIDEMAAKVGNFFWHPKDVSLGSEPEPGAVAVRVTSPSLKAVYRVMGDKLKSSVGSFNLRDFMLTHCNDLNTPEFFMLMQASLLVFCPSLGMAIIFQCVDSDMDEFDTEQHAQDDQYIDWCQMQPTMQMQPTTQSMMSQTQFSQTQFMEQFVQFVRQLIAQCSESQSQQQMVAMTKQAKSIESAIINSIDTIEEDKDEEQERVGGEEQRGDDHGEGRQGTVTVTATVWRTVVIHF